MAPDATVSTPATVKSSNIGNLLAQLAITQLALVPAACAAETVPAGLIDLLQQFLVEIEALGAVGAAIFVLAVMFAEMVPLLPTQPLSLAAGLLFGPIKGTGLVLLGLLLAAYNSFTIASGIGKPLAERVIRGEMGEGGHGSSGAVMAKIAEVEEAIRTGGFWKQFTAVMLLRLTPVVPFSASNYVLGLMPLQVGAFLGGTAVGMVAWVALYTSLGAASRKLLDSGVSLSVIFEGLADKSGEYGRPIAMAGIVMAGVAAGGSALWSLSRRSQPLHAAGSSGSSSGAGAARSSANGAVHSSHMAAADSNGNGVGRLGSRDGDGQMVLEAVGDSAGVAVVASRVSVEEEPREEAHRS